MIQLMDKPSRKQVGMVHSNTGELGGYSSYSPGRFCPSAVEGLSHLGIQFENRIELSVGLLATGF